MKRNAHRRYRAPRYPELRVFIRQCQRLAGVGAFTVLVASAGCDIIRGGQGPSGDSVEPWPEYACTLPADGARTLHFSGDEEGWIEYRVIVFVRTEEAQQWFGENEESVLDAIDAVLGAYSLTWFAGFERGQEHYDEIVDAVMRAFEALLEEHTSDGSRGLTDFSLFVDNYHLEHQTGGDTG
jgi:hypothetical protein